LYYTEFALIGMIVALIIEPEQHGRRIKNRRRSKSGDSPRPAEESFIKNKKRIASL